MLAPDLALACLARLYRAAQSPNQSKARSWPGLACFVVEACTAALKDLSSSLRFLACLRSLVALLAGSVGTSKIKCPVHPPGARPQTSPQVLLVRCARHGLSRRSLAISPARRSRRESFSPPLLVCKHYQVPSGRVQPDQGLDVALVQLEGSEGDNVHLFGNISPITKPGTCGL